MHLNMNQHQKAHYDNITKITQEKLGKLFSTVYYNKKHKLEFKCQYDHIWET